MSELTDRYNEASEDAVSSKMRAHAISTVRYKVYVFIIVVILVFIWPMFVEEVEKLRGVGSMDKVFSLGEIPNIVTNFTKTRGEGGVLNVIDGVKSDIEEKEGDIKNAIVVTEIIQSLSKPGKQNNIKNCLNDENCDEMDKRLIPLLPLLRTYLLIGNLSGEKMNFDQKVILKNINDYLLQTAKGGLSNGELESIQFGAPILLDENLSLYKIPITLSIGFEHKKMLISFLHNLEERITYTIPILYKVHSLSYDIAEYNESQSVQMSVDAYYISTLGDLEESADDASGKEDAENAAVEDSAAGN